MIGTFSFFSTHVEPILSWYPLLYKFSWVRQRQASWVTKHSRKPLYRVLLTSVSASMVIDQSGLVLSSELNWCDSEDSFVLCFARQLVWSIRETSGGAQDNEEIYHASYFPIIEVPSKHDNQFGPSYSILVSFLFAFLILFLYAYITRLN